MTVTFRAPILRRRPLTLLERRGRGWLDGLVRGYAPHADAVKIERDSHDQNAFRPCSCCGLVALVGVPFTDGQHTRIFDECPRCRHSVEHIGRSDE